MAREQLVQRHTLLLQRACVLAAARALALVELAYKRETPTGACLHSRSTWPPPLSLSRIYVGVCSLRGVKTGISTLFTFLF